MSGYIANLRDRSQWVVDQFGTLFEMAIRRQTAANIRVLVVG